MLFSGFVHKIQDRANVCLAYNVDILMIVSAEPFMYSNIVPTVFAC